MLKDSLRGDTETYLLLEKPLARIQTGLGTSSSHIHDCFLAIEVSCPTLLIEIRKANLELSDTSNHQQAQLRAAPRARASTPR